MSILQTSSAEQIPDGSFLVDVHALYKPFFSVDALRALFTHETYEYDPVPDNNWLYAAFKGFQALKQDPQRCIRTFATVGTGPGLDAIGAAHIFRPAHVIATDMNALVLPVAEKNILDHVPDSAVRVSVLQGNLCAPLRDAGFCADLIYANLPLLPADAASLIQGMRSSTFAPQEILATAPEVYRQYQLGMIYQFLCDARSSLTENGSVAINLGCRVPLSLVRQMFQDCGYTYRELFVMLKKQSQPDDVLPGFSSAEQEEGIVFDFYRYDEALHAFPLDTLMSAESLKQALLSFRVSAKEAQKLHESGVVIGHIVQMIEGKVCIGSHTYCTPLGHHDLWEEDDFCRHSKD